MSEVRHWNDESRGNLREILRWVILGEVRLSKHSHEEIRDICRETYVQDDCPEDEWQTFVEFAAGELDLATTKLAAEMSCWPDETDCDRLDRVEGVLRERGILLWQASPCCDSCTGSELPDRIDAIEGRYPGFRNRVRGYAFFIDQGMPEMLSDGTEISVYLAYGWLSMDDSKVASDVYMENSLGIAHEVSECLRGEGFKVDWNGECDHKIGLSLNWQRRTTLA